MKKIGEDFVVREVPADYAFVDCFLRMILDTFCFVSSDEVLSQNLQSSVDYIESKFPLLPCDECLPDDFVVSRGFNFIDD